MLLQQDAAFAASNARSLLIRTNLNALKGLRRRSGTEFDASRIHAADVKDALSRVVPEDAATLSLCLNFIWSVAHFGGRHGCDVLVTAGCVPVAFEALRSWPEEQLIVHWACSALRSLVINGASQAKRAIRNVHDYAELLLDAQASKLECYNDGKSVAALTLKAVTPSCSIL